MKGHVLIVHGGGQGAHEEDEKRRIGWLNYLQNIYEREERRTRA